MRLSGFLAGLLLMILPLSQVSNFAKKRELYQLKIYHLKDSNQRERLETYFKQAYLPALHHAGIGKVGVFKLAGDVDSLVYVLIPFKSADPFSTLSDKMANDKSYLAAGEDYLNTSFENPVFKNIESIFMEAIVGMLMLQVPAHKSDPAETIYELRRYEAASEKAA